MNIVYFKINPPSNEQSYKVWCPLVLRFQRRLKCKLTYDDQVDDGVWWLRRTPSDGNTSKTKLCRGTIIQWTVFFCWLKIHEINKSPKDVKKGVVCFQSTTLNHWANTLVLNHFHSSKVFYFYLPDNVILMEDGNTSKTKLCRGTIIQWTCLPGLVPFGSVVSDWEEKSKM
jgi:hypothetical protein